MRRPQPNEAEAYYHLYVDKVPDGDVTELLDRQIDETTRLLAAVPEDRAGHRYAPGKWSIKEVVGHVADVERMTAFRAFTFARGDSCELPSFDQDPYVTNAGFDRRTLADIVAELRAVRAASRALIRSFDDEIGDRTGVASGCRFTVRSLVYVLLGHELHHRQVLRERYL